MKNFLKINFIKAGMAIALFLFIAYSGVVSAQLRVPLLPDNLWVTSPILIDGINTAIIDLPPTNPSSHTQLMACAFSGSGGANPGGIVVTDYNSGFTVNLSYPVVGGPGYTMVSTPDIILGNNTTSGSPTKDFIMATCFINNGGNIEIDYFDIHYYSPVAFTVTFNTYNIIPALAYQTVHMAVLADRTIPSLYAGLPVCDKFFITFDAGSSSKDVLAAYGSLNAYSLLSPVVNVPYPIHHTDNIEPDVAAVQMQPKGPMGTIDNTAIITWLNQGRAQIYSLTWDVVTGIVAGGSYSTVFTGPFYKPRIDANGDYLTNMSATNSNFKIAAQVYNMTTGVYDVHTYDNLASDVHFSSLVGLSGISYTPYNAFAPTVAYGPNSSSQYIVSDCEEFVGFPGYDYILMGPVNQNAPMAVAPDPNGFASFFLVNYTYPCNSTACNYSNSSSTPCNNVSDMSLVAWAFFDGTNYNISFKTTYYNPAAIPFNYGYAYREQQEAGPMAQTYHKITIWPNPAFNLLSIGNPKVKGADRYMVRNIIGQIVREGSLATGSQEISLNTLLPGNYFISFYCAGERLSEEEFVKIN